MKKKDKYLKFLIIFILFVSSQLSLAFDTGKCSITGYTVATINGVFTDEQGAGDNMIALKKKLGPFVNNQSINYQYLLNPSHLAGLGDLVEVAYQKYFDDEAVQDYDLVEMLKRSSDKINTQKILLVAHSQGNFYANSFYDSVADKQGGIPSQSIGVYGVATPSSRVAGNGSWLTSSTDKVISGLVGRVLSRKIMSANASINFTDGDDSMGHDFSKVYLKYEGGKIVSDILASLQRLRNNNIQKPDSPCISPPKLSVLHKIEGGVLAVADPVALGTRTALVSTIEVGYAMGAIVRDATSKLAYNLAKFITSFGSNNTADVLLANDANPPSPNNSNVVENPPAPFVSIIKKTSPKTNTGESPSVVAVIETQKQVAPALSKIVEIFNNPIPKVNQPTPRGVNFSGGGGGGGIAGVIPLIPEPVIEVPPLAVLPIDTPPPEIIVDVILPIPPAPLPPDTTPPIITLQGKATETVLKNGVFVDPGVTAIDDVDGIVEVSEVGSVDPTILGYYTLTYTAKDSKGNTSTLERKVHVTSRQYIPKYKFGSDNGDGNDWQVWAFNGSNIYAWSDVYVNHYLREQFKVHRYGNLLYNCSDCLLRGVFNHDPQLGFEQSDILFMRPLEGNNPQFYLDGIYDVDVQWDATGYTFTSSSSGNVISTEHVDIANLDNNAWTGWSAGYNQFENFPSGNWLGHSGWFPGGYENGLTGGQNMILPPYPIYQP